MSVMPNPLIAERVDSTQWFSGIFILEDLDTIEHGIASGSWVEVGLGGFAGTLDAISAIVNPLEAVVSWGVAWLIEHFEPLSDALEVLAGDADQIMAFAQTWENIANALKSAGEQLRSAIDRETLDWTGAAAEAYRTHMNEELGAVQSLIKVSSVLSTVVKGAGLLVSFVRQMVRDLVAQAVGAVAGELPMLLAEEGVTLGLATPVVVGQVAALVGKWIARIKTLLTALIKSIRNLIPILRHLDEVINALVQLIKKLTRRSPHGGPHTPRAEAPRAARPRRFTTEEVDDIARHLEEADTPQPGHPQPGGHGPRAIAGEQGMGFHYSQEKGWAFLDGPSGTGAGGHPWNAGGPDGFAFRTEGDFEMHILDNKSVADAGNVSKASALTDTLADNVHQRLAQAMDPAMNDVPRINEVRKALADTETALRNGTPLPPEVHLVVTNEGGRASGVTQNLANQGIEFRDIQTPPQVPPAPPPAPPGQLPRVAPPPARDEQ
jgi:uncharacterized protein YukE